MLITEICELDVMVTGATFLLKGVRCNILRKSSYTCNYESIKSTLFGNRPNHMRHALESEGFNLCLRYIIQSKSYHMKFTVKKNPFWPETDLQEIVL